MSTMSISSNAGVMMQNPGPGISDADQMAGAESSILRAMAEAETIMGQAALKENADSMKASMDNREIALQKKRVAVHQSAQKELDAAWDKNVSMIVNGLFSLAGAGASFACVYAAGGQMRKAVTEGCVAEMTRYTPRGNKLDTWNSVGAAGQTTGQSLGSITSSIGQKFGSEREYEKNTTTSKARCRTATPASPWTWRVAAAAMPERRTGAWTR